MYVEAADDQFVTAYIEEGNSFSLFLGIQRHLVIFVSPIGIGFPYSEKITRDK